jgi:hypothetical protein
MIKDTARKRLLNWAITASSGMISAFLSVVEG